MPPKNNDTAPPRRLLRWRGGDRIALSSGLPRKQVASDLQVGFSRLNRWVTAYLGTQLLPDKGLDLARENVRQRPGTCILGRRIRLGQGNCSVHCRAMRRQRFGMIRNVRMMAVRATFFCFPAWLAYAGTNCVQPPYLQAWRH